MKIPANEQALPGTQSGIIQMQGVVKTFTSSAGEFTALRGIDLNLQEGEFAAVIGKSGSGKSTLLNMLTGIDHPTSGQVLVDGVDLYAMSESKRSLWRGRNLGIVFQFFQLLPMLNLLENVMLPMDYVGMYDIDQRPKKAMELLTLVGLEEQAQMLPRAVSRGQQQSAAIARALANDAPILVADEPTGNLDSLSASKIIDLFEKLSGQGKTIIMVTHDPSMTQRTSRTVFISDGELVNETIAQALPLLNHSVMQELGHRVKTLHFQPGATILEHKKRVDNVYLIQKGKVDIVLKQRRSDDVVISTLQRNDIFGEIELLQGGKSIASVRASIEGAVDLLALSREDFNWLMKESPLTEKAMTEMVQERLEERKGADRRKKRRGLFG
ncbi:MAG: ATP-binding cassette domain-containing protein [Anaerolineales bacterium]|nr:ATP-binding cassette domain-containing protein [Anaerolineales bacterium]